jgi:hypothetical protein
MAKDKNMRITELHEIHEKVVKWSEYVKELSILVDQEIDKVKQNFINFKNYINTI